MTSYELVEYVQNHPQWDIPTGLEAVDIDHNKIDWEEFRVSESIEGRELIYNKKTQCFKISHPAFKVNVVLVEAEKEIT
jgi:hypothetical protein